MSQHRIAVIPAVLALVACGSDSPQTVPEDVSPDQPEATIPYETLSEYGLFQGDGSTQQPADGVVGYTVNVQLFADQASKFRFIVLPEGGTISYDADENWSFPVGTIIVKTFAYHHDLRDLSQGFRLVETRLLIHQEDGWTPHVYVWNDEQTEAYREIVPAPTPVTWIDRDGVTRNLDYRIPNTNQCRRCHGDPDVSTLGLHTRQINTDNIYDGGTLNQLAHFESLGMFSDPLPPEADRPAFPKLFDEEAPVEERARAYLDANCSHCHSPGGAAGTTNLFLAHEIDNPVDYGICRTPFSAGAGTGGRLWDIVPGAPDESILVYRLESTDPEVKMPELPSQLSDADGVSIVRRWIEGMDPVDCAGR